MGVRLVRHNRANTEAGGSSSFNDHDELINRDMMNQHPIYAIIGLQEVLNILEDAVQETNQLVITKETEIYTEINTHVTDILADIAVIDQQIDDITNTINNSNIINSVIDTNTVDLTYDTTVKSLKADVKIHSDTNNLIQTQKTGVYVPKITPVDTESIIWDKILNQNDIHAFYDKCKRFSHCGTSWSNLYYPTGANSWAYVSYPLSLHQPLRDTTSFNGIVSSEKYDFYTHVATIKSTVNQGGINGLVIGYALDELNHPHTLSVVVSRGTLGGGFYYAIVYDLMLPDQSIIKAGNALDGNLQTNAGNSGWSYFSYGITLRTEKRANLISVATSNWNNVEINEATKMSIDLNDYDWGHLFANAVQYGYCSYYNQANYFSNINFTYDNLALSILSAQTKLSADVTNGLLIKTDGLYSETLKISTQAKNALIKNTDGYYVEKTEVSLQPDNSLKKLADGYYVRDESNSKLVSKSNHGFVEGDFIFYHPITGYAKASALDDYNSNIVGMVTKIIDVNSFEYKWAGFHKTNLFTNTNGYGQGMPLYISDTDPGKVVQDQPDISKTVGYPIEDIGLIISIERGIQYNQETAIGDFKQSANTYNVRSDGFIKVAEGILYKQTLVDRLLTTLDESFKTSYLIINDSDQTISFTNTQTLYDINLVREGFNLFIKAF